MINFKIESDNKSDNLIKVRRLAVTITTVLLVIYLVAIAGFFGWGAYWSRKEVSVSNKYEDVTAKLNNLAQEEIMVRKLSDRLDSLNLFLDSRRELAPVIVDTVSENMGIKSWLVDAGGKVTVSVFGPSPEEIKLYTDNLLTRFDTVQVGSVKWTPTEGWVGVISLKGNKTNAK